MAQVCAFNISGGIDDGRAEVLVTIDDKDIGAEGKG